jgi:hypothetical protein
MFPTHVTEDVVNRIDWNRWLTALALVKVGQDLGAESSLSRAVYDLVSLASAFALK